jgi:hypothetical protein
MLWPCFAAVDRYPRMGVAISGALLAGEPPGDVLLDLAGPQVAFGLVGGGGNLQVVGEAQDVGFPVVQNLQQQPGFALSGAVHTV